MQSIPHSNVLWSNKTPKSSAVNLLKCGNQHLINRSIEIIYNRFKFYKNYHYTNMHNVL